MKIFNDFCSLIFYYLAFVGNIDGRYVSNSGMSTTPFHNTTEYHEIYQLMHTFSKHQFLLKGSMPTDIKINNIENKEI